MPTAPCPFKCRHFHYDLDEATLCLTKCTAPSTDSNSNLIQTLWALQMQTCSTTTWMTPGKQVYCAPHGLKFKSQALFILAPSNADMFHYDLDDAAIRARLPPSSLPPPPPMPPMVRQCWYLYWASLSCPL